MMKFLKPVKEYTTEVERGTLIASMLGPQP
jgi:hypothetical protein